MRRSMAVGCFVGVLVCGLAFADQVIQKPVAADTTDKFQQVATQIRADMTTGGRYEFIRPDEKAKVEIDLDAMTKMMQQSGSVAAMSQDQKVLLFNTQEHLNGILTHNDVNRLVCEHAAAIGSHIQTTTCKTVGDIERQRGSAKQLMDYKEEKSVIPLVNTAAGPKEGH